MCANRDRGEGMTLSQPERQGYNICGESTHTYKTEIINAMK